MRFLLTLLLTVPVMLIAGTAPATQAAFPDEYYERFDWTQFEQWETANQKIDLRHVDYSLLQAAIFYYTNQYRISKKLGPLAYQPALGSAASYHGQQMGDRRFYDHVNPYDKSMRTAMERSKKFGFSGATIGENLALEFVINYKAQQKYWYEVTNAGVKYYYGDSGHNRGYVPEHTYLSLGKSIVNAWINSPAHRENLLYEEFKYLGVGVYLEPETQGNKNIPRIYATQVFGG